MEKAVLETAFYVLGTMRREQRFPDCRHGLRKTGFLGCLLLGYNALQDRALIQTGGEEDLPGHKCIQAQSYTPITGCTDWLRHGRPYNSADLSCSRFAQKGVASNNKSRRNYLQPSALPLSFEHGYNVLQICSVRSHNPPQKLFRVLQRDPEYLAKFLISKEFHKSSAQTATEDFTSTRRCRSCQFCDGKK